MIRIAVADDHDVLRDGLVAILQGQDDMEPVGDAADGETLLDLYATTQPNWGFRRAPRRRRHQSAWDWPRSSRVSPRSWQDVTMHQPTATSAANPDFRVNALLKRVAEATRALLEIHDLDAAIDRALAALAAAGGIARVCIIRCDIVSDDLKASRWTLTHEWNAPDVPRQMDSPHASGTWEGLEPIFEKHPWPWTGPILHTMAEAAQQSARVGDPSRVHLPHPLAGCAGQYHRF